MIGDVGGPRVARSLEVRSGEHRLVWSGAIRVGAVDTWIGVDAGGDQPLPVELTGTYQLEKGRDGVAPYALINPILVDADGDGRWRRGAADVVVE